MKKKILLLFISGILTLFFAGCGNQKKSEMSDYLSGILGDYGLTKYEVTEVDESGNLKFLCEEYESLDDKTKKNLMKELIADDTVQEMTDSGSSFVDVEIYVEDDVYYYYNEYYQGSTEQHGLWKVTGSKSKCVYEDRGF